MPSRWARGRRGCCYDALVDPEFDRCSRRDPGAARRDGLGRRAPRAPLGTTLEALGGRELPARISEGEQSNTTIIYGDKLLLKIFRQVEEGISPELEIGRFLTEQQFRGTPRLAGAIEYQARGREATTVAMLQEYVRSQSDAWTSTLEALNRFFERVLTDEGSAKGARRRCRPARSSTRRARRRRRW